VKPLANIVEKEVLIQLCEHRHLVLLRCARVPVASVCHRSREWAVCPPTCAWSARPRASLSLRALHTIKRLCNWVKTECVSA